MSLINDALKRASKATLKSDSTAAGPAMQPADSAAKKGPSMITIVGLVILLAGGFYFWKTNKRPGAAGPSAGTAGASNKVDKGIAAKPAASATNLAKATPSSNNVAVTQSNRSTNLPGMFKAIGQAKETLSKLPKSDEPISMQTPAPTPVEPAPTPAVPLAPKPETHTEVAVEKSDDAPRTAFPALKLQGIFYRLAKSTVLINGRTLQVGETIDGAKVVEIDRQSVTLEMNGQRKTLTIAVH